MDTPMDITIMERDLLKLNLRLKLKLNPTMDILVDMDIPTLVDITMERDLLKLSQKQLLLLKLILKLIPGMDTMVVTMDILIMDMDTGAERRGKLSLLLLLKLILRLIPGMDTMVDTTDTPMVITGAESK